MNRSRAGAAKRRRRHLTYRRLVVENPGLTVVDAASLTGDTPSIAGAALRWLAERGTLTRHRLNGPGAPFCYHPARPPRDA